MSPQPNSKLPEFAAAAEPPAWMRNFPTAPVPVTQQSMPRAVFLAAHPDDETIGASAALSRLPHSVVVYVTDGAPHDPRFWSSFTGSREEYARVRRCEAEAALALAGIPSQRIVSLEAADQDSIYDVPILVEKLITIARWFRPALLITHPYEGGHPDHDSAALVANIARRCLMREGVKIQLLEMTSYHARDAQCETGEFLQHAGKDRTRIAELAIDLTAEERELKKEMLQRFASQSGVLQGFRLDPERLREAPDYDFTRPPHDGPLWYELQSWPLSGKRWRELAAQALDNFGEALCA